MTSVSALEKSGIYPRFPKFLFGDSISMSDFACDGLALSIAKNNTHRYHQVQPSVEAIAAGLGTSLSFVQCAAYSGVETGEQQRYFDRCMHPDCPKAHKVPGQSFCRKHMVSCMHYGCKEQQIPGQSFCEKHICMHNGCKEQQIPGQSLCLIHLVECAM